MFVIDEPQSPHRILQLLSINEAWVILIEKLERFLNLINLFLSQVDCLSNDSFDNFILSAIFTYDIGPD